MGSIELFKKPGSVELDGQALHVVAHLSNIAKGLYEAQQKEMPPEVRAEISKACRSLDSLITALTAITETVDYLEIHVEKILAIIPDGESADYVNRMASVHYVISGYLVRKRSTLRVQTFVLNEKLDPLTSNDNGNFQILGC